MAKKFSKPELSRKINGDIPFDDANSVEKPETTRLDVIVLNNNPRFSRATIQKFIKAGYVTVDGVVTDKPNTPIEDGMEVILNVPEQEQRYNQRPAEPATTCSPAYQYNDERQKRQPAPSQINIAVGR